MQISQLQIFKPWGAIIVPLELAYSNNSHIPKDRDKDYIDFTEVTDEDKMIARLYSGKPTGEEDNYDDDKHWRDEVN